jgi:DnaD/phage-associated family protein
MSGFSGFPAGRMSYTPLPDLFFSELLPRIDDLAELKVTLHVFWLVYHRRGSARHVTLQELLADGILMAGLQVVRPGGPVAGPNGGARGAPSPDQVLRDGLERAVAHGTLLHLVSTGEVEEHFYLINSAQGRRTVEQAASGLGETELAPGSALSEPVVAVERPNIFVLYEQNIGLLQPMIAEELRDAEDTYPAEWIGEAFHIAVEQNVRNWKYVRRILERWEAEGKDKRREKTWYTDEESKLIKR